jgi:thiamine-phosphate pyrophosphorylase
MKPLPRLIAIADATSPQPEAVHALLDGIETALGEGVQTLLLRAKTLSPRDQWEIGRRVAGLCAAYNATLLISDRADLARALGADGVHLPANGLPVDVARRTLTDHIVGVSCHSVADVLKAEEDGADYVFLSPIFVSASKPEYGPPLGTEVLADACRKTSRPVFALGGVTPGNAGACVDAGARGVAVMSGIFSGDVVANVQKLMREL